ncbi:MAG: hypothetical protein ACK53Y_23795, partial [bacterium]
LLTASIPVERLQAIQAQTPYTGHSTSTNSTYVCPKGPTKHLSKGRQANRPNDRLQFEVSLQD